VRKCVGHHPFSIPDELAQPDGALTVALVDFVKSAG
jgi:hypothetical protein